MLVAAALLFLLSLGHVSSMIPRFVLEPDRDDNLAKTVDTFFSVGKEQPRPEIADTPKFSHFVDKRLDDENLEYIRDHTNDIRRVKGFLKKTGQLKFASVSVIEKELVETLVDVMFKRREFLSLLGTPSRDEIEEMVREMIRLPMQKVLAEKVAHKIYASQAYHDDHYDMMLRYALNERIMDMLKHLEEARSSGHLSTEDIIRLANYVNEIAYFDGPRHIEFKKALDRVIEVFRSGKPNVFITTRDPPTESPAAPNATLSVPDEGKSNTTETDEMPGSTNTTISTPPVTGSLGTTSTISPASSSSGTSEPIPTRTSRTTGSSLSTTSSIQTSIQTSASSPTSIPVNIASHTSSSNAPADLTTSTASQPSSNGTPLPTETTSTSGNVVSSSATSAPYPATTDSGIHDNSWDSVYIPARTRATKNPSPIVNASNATTNSATSSSVTQNSTLTATKTTTTDDDLLELVSE